MPSKNNARRRRRMVEEQIAVRGVRDARVLRAMEEVPRELFLGADMAELLPEQFDEYVWFDATQAVRPLGASGGEGAADTYPFGV